MYFINIAVITSLLSNGKIKKCGVLAHNFTCGCTFFFLKSHVKKTPNFNWFYSLNPFRNHLFLNFYNVVVFFVCEPVGGLKLPADEGGEGKGGVDGD